LRADTVIAVTTPSLLHNPFLTLRGRSELLLHDLFPRHFPLVEALILNRRERVDRAVRDRFARAGLSHLLAISGSHVAILAGVLLVVGGMLPIPRRRITWVTIALVCLYLVLIGAPASAVRSGAMVSLVLLSSLLQRPSAILPIASAACLLIVALRPLAVLEVGLQLSFAGVFGIMAAQRTLGRHVARLGRGRPWLSLAETLLISAAAFLATAPITAYQFGTIAPVAIVANVPAIPLTGLALIGVLAAAASAPIRPLADLLAAGTGLTLDLLDRVATVAATIPYGSATVARPDLVAWAVAAVAGAALLGLARRGRAAVRAGVAGGTVAAVLIAWPVLGRSSAQGLEIHFLDVGQGDAVALRTPRGRWILVDAGPRSAEYDAGERRVVPFFRAHGVTRLEALVLTHPDADHIGGVAAVMHGLQVKRVIEPGVAVGKELYLEVLAEVERRGGQWIAARSGRALRLDGIEMRFLWPDEEVVARAVDANDASAISIVTFGEFSIVLPGDASSEVERELVERHGPALRSSVLKAGHHGSATSTSAEFLRAVAPELVVISAGRRNRYGHPAPEVVARLKEAGIEIARTDLEGTVSLRVPADGRTPWQRIGQ
jgi:competence protein ComEC